MSDRRALLVLAMGVAAYFLVPTSYAPYLLGVLVFGLIIYLAFKIDDLRADLTAAQADIKELQASARKRDLEE